jgi:hypothetical protein
LARFLKISLLSIPLLLLLALLLVSSWFYTYHSLTREALVAEISFEPVADKHWRARLATGDHCRIEYYEIHGDQWRIEAQFIKWKYWASLLGLDAMYRLDRFEGRYQDVDEQNRRHKVAYSLAQDSALDMVAVAEALGGFNFLFDASYGSSTYHAIDNRQLYRVYRTQTGLITRTEPKPRTADNGAILSIEITRACAGKPGLWRRASTWLDESLSGWR